MKPPNKGILLLGSTGRPSADSNRQNEECSAESDNDVDNELYKSLYDDDCAYDYDDDLLALGTYVGSAHISFHVVIYYREPHTLKHGSQLPPLQYWELEVSALSADEAKQTATNDFRLIESLSKACGAPRREILATEVDDHSHGQSSVDVDSGSSERS